VDGHGDLLEVHLFAFSEDIYGSRLSVRLIAHIRGDVKFPSLELMTAQMERDRAAAINILQACPPCGS
jgi:riboflavin kinase/FMN adenylyltransferase